MRLNTELGAVVAVEFPANTAFSGAPAIGNAAFFAVEGHQGQPDEKRVRLLIRPKLPEGIRDPRPRLYYGQRSNIQIFLVGAPTLNLRVRIAAPDRAVYQAFIHLPERSAAFAQAERSLAAERRRLQQEFESRRAQLDAQISAEAFTHVLDGMAERFECRQLSGRSMRDYLIFRTHAICRIGRYVYITFSVKNRRRSSVFHFDEMRVIEAGQDPSVGTLDVSVRFEKRAPALAFGDRTRGVLGFRLTEDARQFGPWHLTLVEDGGANRRVGIEDVGF